MIAAKDAGPSFIDAAPPDKAEMLYQQLIELLSKMGIPVKSGIFQAMMDVKLVNDGPVTILLDSSKLF